VLESAPTALIGPRCETNEYKGTSANVANKNRSPSTRALPQWHLAGRVWQLVGLGFVGWRRLLSHAILPGALALALALVMIIAVHSPGFAQGKLEARYNFTLAGLPIGQGAWVIDVADDQFTMSASGATYGLMRIFAGAGRGQSAARGKLTAGQPVSSTYASTITTDKKYDEVHMVISSGTVKEFVADPPTVPTPDRVPLTEAHRRGVSDPLTASLMRVPGSGDTFGPQACPRKISVFDGRMRYDLQLAYRRLDQVKAEKGYQGKAVVCSLVFLPIAGHIPERTAIKYLAQLRDIELWLAPVAGTRLMVPYRLSIPTPLGVGLMQATQFVSVAQPGRSSANTQ
jgi:Protein of unknown function (DUF3108)